MAFSYSDENFTVVGNLCFVHIKTTKKGPLSFRIPPALADRMMIKDYAIIAASADLDKGNAISIYAIVEDKNINFYATNSITYLNFYFPIDSNK